MVGTEGQEQSARLQTSEGNLETGCTFPQKRGRVESPVNALLRQTSLQFVLTFSIPRSLLFDHRENTGSIAPGYFGGFCWKQLFFSGTQECLLLYLLSLKHLPHPHFPRQCGCLQSSVDVTCFLTVLLLLPCLQRAQKLTES